MDSLPFLILLAPYLLILAVAVLFLFFNIYHLWQYGVDSMGTKLMILLYLGIFTITAGGTWIALRGFSWEDSFSLADILPYERGISSFGL